MLNHDLIGSGVYDESSRFRMYVIVVFGIFAFGSVLYWRSQAFLASESIELPQHKVAKRTKATNGRYNVEYLDETLNQK